MQIGDASRATGLTIKAIRHYEAKGLLPTVRRRGTYRDYTSVELRRLELIGHCRSLGFAVDEIRGIIALVDEAAPECPEPHSMSQLIDAKLRRVRAEISSLQRCADRLEEAARYVKSRRLA